MNPGIGFRTLHSCTQTCGSLYCPVCRLDAAVRHVRVRGLCPDSIYNSAYTLTMTGEGTVGRRFGYYVCVNSIFQKVRFLGHKTSSIQFDPDQQLWHWRDMKDAKSVATRTV